MLRDKDKNLARACTVLAESSLEALQWINHPDNEVAVGVKRASLTKAFRKFAVDGRKLAQAALRPMSVAVFGASQAGKSYMVGDFISPKRNPVKVIFSAAGDPPIKLNFLETVNPQGGVETTGIVTRFSTQPQDGAPKGFPVTLRALREVDVAKILCNTHLMELKAGWEDGKEFDPERHARDVMSLSRNAQAMPGMSLDEIYELRDYIEVHLKHHPLARPAAEPYWAALEEAGPSLGAAARAVALAPIWGELHEFTELYSILKAALDDLKHPTWIYAPIEAILDRSHGVLHAETLYALDMAFVDSLEGAAQSKATRTSIAADTGARLDLPRPVVTALAAELRVTLDGRPWDFLEHTDLLDFPGAKSREDRDPESFLRDVGRNNARAYCYLRGKVAVLFDMYVDDLEANALVLSVDDSQGEVKKLPQLVEEWIHRSHGKTPQERALVSPVSLFFTIMKGDTLFKLDLGADAGTTIQNRLKNNLHQYPGWTKEWTPGKPFKNVFLFRNTSFHQPGIINYAGPWPTTDNGVKDKPEEAGYVADFAGRRGVYEKAFLDNSLVRDHIGEAVSKFNALLSINDGGISYLAEALAPVCDMDLKFRQIEPAKSRLQKNLLDAVNEFHETSDVTRRIAERVARVTDVVGQLFVNADLFGPFINEFQLRPDQVGKLYLEYTVRRGAKAQSASAVSWATGDEAKRSSAFGAYVLKAWEAGLVERTKDNALAASFNLSPEQVGAAASELVGYAARIQLEAQIDDRVAVIERTPRRPDEIAYRVGMTTATLINNTVGYLGANTTTPVATAPKYPDLPNDVRDLAKARGAYFRSWISQLKVVTGDNAREGQGGKVKPEQNAKLSAIIERIEGQ